MENESKDFAKGAFVRDLINDRNNLSFWFPKVKGCGIRVPETTVIPFPAEHLKDYIDGTETGDDSFIRSFVHEKIMPVVEAMEGLPFIKNGTFSNKFDFAVCCPPDRNEETILRSVKEIQYTSLCFETMGNLEIAVRERIPDSGRPRIYNGMPLNPELRLFYDFDAGKPLYIVNYWDWEYCHDGIKNTDVKTYKDFYPTIESDYQANVQRVYEEASRALKDVKGLDGVWSVDFLIDGEGTLWLIDMAEARKSAYWNPDKAILCGHSEAFTKFIQDHEGAVSSWTRRKDITDLRFGLSDRYLLVAMTELLGAYLHSPFGHKAFGGDLEGEKADAFNAWDFIEREIPRTVTNLQLMEEANLYNGMAESPQTNAACREAYMEMLYTLTDRLFWEAAAAFIETKWNR